MNFSVSSGISLQFYISNISKQFGFNILVIFFFSRFFFFIFPPLSLIMPFEQQPAQNFGLWRTFEITVPLKYEFLRFLRDFSAVFNIPHFKTIEGKLLRDIFFIIHVIKRLAFASHHHPSQVADDTKLNFFYPVIYYIPHFKAICYVFREKNFANSCILFKFNILFHS